MSLDGNIQKAAAEGSEGFSRQQTNLLNLRRQMQDNTKQGNHSSYRNDSSLIKKREGIEDPAKTIENYFNDNIVT